MKRYMYRFLSVVALLLVTTGCRKAVEVQPLVSVDYEALISESDFIYNSPADAPYKGQPIGNGVMGTMVWTSSDSVKFQINRSDRE